MDKKEIVLLGECTHGTREFYEIRAQITKDLIKKGYRLVLLEANWHAMMDVNYYVMCYDGTSNGLDALQKLRSKYPQWMWGNETFLELVEWIREFNEKISEEKDMVMVLGIDCYELLESFDDLICLFRSTPIYSSGKISAEKSKPYTQTLEMFLNKYKSAQEYARDIVNNRLGPRVMALYQEILAHVQETGYKEHVLDPMDYISAEQSCEIIINSDEYFRKQILEPPGSNASWNARDQHMTLSIMRLRESIREVYGLKVVPKVVVWAHNSHVGSSLAGVRGGVGFEKNDMWNLGQMIKSMYGDDLVEIYGFYTARGTVSASSEWGGECQVFELNEPREGSLEDVLSQDSRDSFMVDLKSDKGEIYHQPIMQRWIGVSYKKDKEKESHYGEIIVSKAYDKLWFVRETTHLKLIDS